MSSLLSWTLKWNIIQSVKMYGPTTQCISITYYQMFQLSAIVPNLCPQPKSSLTNFDQWPSAGCLTNRHSDVASTRQHLTQNFNRPTPIALPRFCNSRTKVWNIKMSQVWHYNWSPVKWLCMHSVLARCTFSKLVPRLWLYKEYMEYIDDRKFIEVYVCQKLS